MRGAARQPCGSAHSHSIIQRTIYPNPSTLPIQRRAFLSTRGWTPVASGVGGTGSSDGPRFPSLDDADPAALPDNFCIIESRDTVKDFEDLGAKDLRQALSSRRNRIFLLMEEVRRLRIQLRMKGGDVDRVQEIKEERFMSALPFLPPLTQETLKTYSIIYLFLLSAIIAFGALLAPILEVKLGVGGTSYLEFVESLQLPAQLAAVDPIVASFCGGSVGVLSALLVIETNNIKKQQRNRCHYCEGTGYLACGQCIGTGIDTMAMTAASAGGGLINMSGGARGAVRVVGQPCALCSSTGKVMCTGCLCTGKQMATEHDPRIDPFD